MLDFFVDGDLPGEEPGLIYPRKDVANLKDVWLAGQILGFGCAESQHLLGWGSIGEHSTHFFKHETSVVVSMLYIICAEVADCRWLILSRPGRKHRSAYLETGV